MNQCYLGQSMHDKEGNYGRHYCVPFMFNFKFTAIVKEHSAYQDKLQYRLSNMKKLNYVLLIKG